MLESDVRIKNTLGLHARAAAQVVQLAGKFTCRISLERRDNGVMANAKSILSVLHLAAAFGVVVTIITDGADEKEALRTLEKLFADKFGED